MKDFYFCAQTVVWHDCGIKGKGRLCSLGAGGNSIRQSILLCVLFCLTLNSSAWIEQYDSLSVHGFGWKFKAAVIAVPTYHYKNHSFGLSFVARH